MFSDLRINVFTALVEDRPYRQGVGLETVSSVMGDMAEGGAIDERLARLLFSHSAEVFGRLAKACELTDRDCRKFQLMIDAAKAAPNPQPPTHPMEQCYGQQSGV